jgi:hypothetical protein
MCLLSVFLIQGMLAMSIAQSPKERVLEDTIPAHVPIKVRIKKEKEKAYKDLKNAKWARDFELELTNTGDKPIYSIHMVLVLPEIRNETGLNIVFPLTYGRVELGDTRVKAGPEDVPIKPGETYVFRIHPAQVPVWERRQREQNRPQPSILRLKLQLLSFGDGTGFIGPEGTAVPRKDNKLTSGGACVDQLNRSGPKRSLKAHHPQTSIVNLPATFLPVNSLAESSSNQHLRSDPSGLLPWNDCTSLTPHFENVCVNCPDQKRPSAHQAARRRLRLGDQAGSLVPFL